MLADIVEMLSNMLEDIVAFLPSLIAAIIIILIGYGVGIFVGKAVNKLIEKMGIERNFEKSTTGRAFKSGGLDLSSFVGGVTQAFIVVLSIIFAIEVLNIGGILGNYLTAVASYLPRLLGGILIIVID